jgi:ATPase family AAA domain-containing protein 3A/B
VETMRAERESQLQETQLRIEDKLARGRQKEALDAEDELARGRLTAADELARDRQQAAHRLAEQLAERIYGLQRADEDRRLEVQVALHQQLLADEDRLARTRDSERREAEVELAREVEALRAKAQLELARETEAVRMETEVQLIKRKAEAEAEAAVTRAKAEAEARILEARETEELNQRAAAAAAAAEKEKLQSAIDAVFAQLGAGFNSLLHEHLSRVLLATLALVLGYFGAREGWTLLFSELQRLLGQPSLVRETSKVSFITALFRAIFCCGRKRVVVEGLLDGVILPPDLERQVRRLAESTKRAHENRAPLRHALFYGPPGTGKTMVAERLARHCGLDYALMSGGDVAPLGSMAVAELNKLFSWAKSTSRGTLLFIDEADTFLASRTGRNNAMSETMRNCLSAFLHHTGEQSTKLMMVLCTNRPGELDSAVTDRIDEALMFGSPSQDQRKRLGRLYFYKHITSRSQLRDAAGPVSAIPSTEELEAARERNRGLCKAMRRAFAKSGPPAIYVAHDVSVHLLDDIAKRADGFSGRHMAKFMLTLQATAYASQGYAEEAASEGTESGHGLAHLKQGQFILNASMIRTVFEEELNKLAKHHVASIGSPAGNHPAAHVSVETLFSREVFSDEDPAASGTASTGNIPKLAPLDFSDASAVGHGGEAVGLDSKGKHKAKKGNHTGSSTHGATGGAGAMLD